MGRFILRCFTLLVLSLFLVIAPEQFRPLKAGMFFDQLTLLHVLWVVWVFDMLAQVVPSTKAVIALGSQKSFFVHFRKALSPVSVQKLRSKTVQAAKRAYIVLALWICLTLALGWLHAKSILGDLAMLWISGSQPVSRHCTGTIPPTKGRNVFRSVNPASRTLGGLGI